MIYIIFAVLFVIDLLIACAYAKEGHPDVTMKAFWEKILASGIFVCFGLYAYMNSDKGPYARLILIALVLGMMGDALLSLDPFFKGENKKRNGIISFVIGAAVFLAGHIVYIVSFVKELKIRDAFNLPAFLILLAVIFVVALAVKKIKDVKLGKAGIPILVYSLGLSSMGALSICLAFFGFKGQFALQAVLVVAPLLFIVSDASLGMKIADKERFDTLKMRYVTLVTYYTAQMLFGLSIALM